MRRNHADRKSLSAKFAARFLSEHPDYRVLRRMEPMRRDGRIEGRSGVLLGCAIDVETTGLDHGTDAVIELALQRFWADDRGRIFATGRRHSWLDDPGTGIPPEVTRITGLSDKDVAGRRIVDAVATSLILDSDFVVAHNAAFDRPFVDKRLPLTAGSRWACSMREVDWRRHGFEGRSLSHLLSQVGLFYEAHRAQTDVTALLHLLDHPLGVCGTVLSDLVRSASRPTWLIAADGAPFERKGMLKARGYRWDAIRRRWSREVTVDAFDSEIEWVALRIYDGRRKPTFRQVTWDERHSTPCP